VAWRTENVLATIAVGMALLWAVGAVVRGRSATTLSREGTDDRP
jgi:hypothetical protein